MGRFAKIKSCYWELAIEYGIMTFGEQLLEKNYHVNVSLAIGHGQLGCSCDGT